MTIDAVNKSISKYNLNIYGMKSDSSESFLIKSNVEILNGFKVLDIDIDAISGFLAGSDGNYSISVCSTRGCVYYSNAMGEFSIKGFKKSLCTDTDGGIEIKKKGTVDQSSTDVCMKKVSPNGYQPVDSCFGADCFITEYFCRNTPNQFNSYLGSEMIACSGDCNNGVCVPKKNDDEKEKEDKKDHEDDDDEDESKEKPKSSDKTDLMILGVKTKKIDGLVEETDSQVNIIVHYKNNSKTAITKPFYISLKTTHDTYCQKTNPNYSLTDTCFTASKLIERVIKPHENYSEVIGTYLYQKDKIEHIKAMVNAGVDIVYEDKNDSTWILNSNKIDEADESNNIIEKTMVINENFSEFLDPVEKINDRASDLFQNKIDPILSEIKTLRDKIKEQQNEIKYLKLLTKDLKEETLKLKDNINNFITYGVDENTKKLGEGERAAVMYSYKKAFNKLPETEEELADAIKIANGRWPSNRNEEAEKKAKEQFKKIYKRIPDMNDSKDNAAITVMTYGLRQKAENRNLESEKKGIITFKNIYGHHPKETEDWNIMQAITYSGSTREADSDKDYLTDEREAELGTDPNNKDSDGDGFLDGDEVNSGFDPLKK